MIRRVSKQRRRPRRRTRRMLAQRLESRRVLATFTADFLTDTASGTCVADDPGGNNECSLRVAIAAANANPGPDRIEIATGNHLLSAGLGSLVINQPADLELVGLGALPTDVEIDGGQSVAVFDISAFGNDYTVRFENLTIQNGTSSASGGAGISTTPESALVLRDVVMRNNLASDANPSMFTNSGGAIVALGDLDIQDSEFTSNVATQNGGAVAIIALDAMTTNVIRNTTFTSNAAGNPAVDFGQGGALFVRGMADLTIDGATFTANDAGDSGGGVYLEADSLNLVNSNFNSNRALGSVSGGGGLYVNSTASVSITGGTFQNNSAVDGGGGLELLNSPAAVDGTTFRSNQVVGSGAGFDNGGGAIAVINNLLVAPAVTLENLIVDQNVAPNAGGIASVNGNVTIRTSSIIGNQATLNGTGSAGGVGAVSASNFDSLIVESSLIEGNTAVLQAGGIGTVDVPVQLVDTELVSNLAAGGPGGGIGMLSNNINAQLIASGATFFQNQSGAEGGGIAVQGGGLLLINTTITENTAGTVGGGIAINSPGLNNPPAISFATVVNNSAPTGSNLSAIGTSVDISGSIFALGDGSGTFVSQGFNLDDGTSMGLNAASDQSNTDPMLDPLADNGGVVRTMALRVGSPAIDAATAAPNLPDVDARGELRPQDGDGDGNAFADLGAFEAPAISQPSLTVSDLSVNEDIGSATITVTLDQATTSFSVQADTVESTASNNTDFTPTSVILNFTGNAGETQTFTVPIVDDLVTENDEQFFVVLGAASSGTVITSDTGRINIVSNNDTSRLSIDNITVNETAGNATVSVMLDNRFESSFSVPVATSNGTAIAGDDYDASATTLNFSGEAGEIQTFDVPLINDSITENSEFFSVILGAASDALIDTSDTGNVTINSDDASVLTIQDVAVNETDGSATVTVLLSGEFETGFDVPVATTDGSATAGVDYTATATTLSFVGLDGESQTFNVPILNDAVTEKDEFFTVDLATASDALIDTSDTAAVTIASEDTSSLTIADLSVNETAGTATISVTLDNAFEGAFTVPTMTTGASATAGVDFSAVTPVLSFAGSAGEIQSFDVPILDDLITENDETFSITLGAASDLLIGTSDSGTVTIVSEDTSAITISDLRVNEDVGTAMVTLTLDSAFESNLSVFVTTVDGSATSGEDYTASTATVTFAGNAGETQGFAIPIIDDFLAEPTESLRILMGAASDPLIRTTDTATLTIDSDDGLLLSIDDVFVSEGDGNATVAVRLNNSSPQSFSVPVFTSDGSAVASADYTAVTTSLNFAGTANEVQTIDIPIVDDAENEMNESFTVNLGVASFSPIVTSDTGLVTIADNDSAPIPMSLDDQLTLNEDDPAVSLDVLSNDTPTGLIITSIAGVSLGSVSIVGGTSISYQPNSNAFGQDVFQYTARDSLGQTSRANVTITIQPINDPPVPVLDTVDVRANLSFSIEVADLLANDAAGPANESDQVLDISAFQATTDEGATVTRDGSLLTFTPDSGFVGTDTFRYTVSDNFGQASDATTDLVFRPNLSGHIFCDQNANGTEDPGEAVAGTRVFLDANGNRQFDNGEVFTLSGQQGDYRFIDAPLGNAIVIVEVPVSCRTIPSNPSVTQSTFDVGNLARSIVATDRDGDGDQDLLIAVDYDNALIVLENQNGQIASKEVLSLGVRPQAVASGPSESGQRPLIALATIGQSEDGGGVFIGNETFEEVEAGNGPIDLVLDDLNMDGSLELITVAFRSSSLLINLLDGSDPLELETNSSQILTIDTGDLDDDGDQDLLVAGIGYGSGSEVTALINQGNLEFSEPKTVGADLSLANEYVDVALVDLDGDGDGPAEVITLDQSGTLRTFDFDGSGFPLLSEHQVVAGASQFALGDFNADSIPDIAVASTAGEAVELLVGLGDGRFESIKRINDIRTPVDLAIVDLEGDGFGEIAVLNLYGDNGTSLGLPSLVTILELDVDEQSVTIDVTDSTLDFTFPGIDPAARMDVNGSGDVTPADALRVINRLGERESQLEGEASATLRETTDVNLDGQTSPLDALLIINHLDAASNRMGVEVEIDFLSEDDEEAHERAVDALLANQLF